MKKVLTIQERVDRLLKEGVDNPKKWMPIHGYEESEDMGSSGWYYEWEQLRAHHLEETKVLFDIIRELASRIK